VLDGGVDLDERQELNARILCSVLLVFWLIPAVVYVVARRNDISTFEIVMVFIALPVAAAIITPESFFSSRSA